MHVNVSLVQFSAVHDKQENLRQINATVAACAAAGSEMVFFPEYSMGYKHHRNAQYFSSIAEPLNGTFVTALQAMAISYHVWISCGIFEQTNALPYNTIVVINAQGALVDFHRKNKLYDAFGARESAECMAGDAPFPPIRTPLGMLGIITCYELRFPLLAAQAKEQGAEVLLVPAGWMAGQNKVLHWETLLRARAIENQLTVIGVNQAAPGIFVGHTAAYQPNGTCLSALGDTPDVLSLSLPLGEN